ncbi:hypothetical protein HNR40_004096 [Nonomuraea endophytica]|uniref:Uncharacterized protein n=1 Tax=Nonomuraea endophytica TaxID=714136 RepID=A0A7W8EFC3_9ACTN|nr:hypothetical protein [Nonomuraea endophytica]
MPARVGVRQAQVVLDGVVEQVDVLEDDGDLVEQGALIEVADVDAADAHASRVDVEEPGDEPRHRRLPGARGLDERGATELTRSGCRRTLS